MDDWTFAYPHYLSKSIANLVRNGWVTITLMETIECERRYPGLIADIFLWLWQHSLIEQQLNDEKGGTDVSYE
jgi:hypothetical protein